MFIKNPDGTIYPIRGTNGVQHVRLGDSYSDAEGVTKIAMLVWDVDTLSWVKYSPASFAGGGGDASATNQSTQITLATATNTKLDTVHSDLDDIEAKLSSDPATQTTLAAVLAKLNASLAVTGPLTDTQLRALAVPVSSSTLASAAKQDTIIANLQALNSLVPTTYDYVSLGYTGEDLTTVTFKSGGSGGTLVSTLTLAYSSSILQSVTRT